MCNVFFKDMVAFLRKQKYIKFPANLNIIIYKELDGIFQVTVTQKSIDMFSHVDMICLYLMVECCYSPVWPSLESPASWLSDDILYVHLWQSYGAIFSNHHVNAFLATLF